MTALVSMERLSFGYDDSAALLVDVDVDIDIDEQQVARLVGQNGSGKSTVMKLMAGHLRATSGRILVGGHPATARAARQRRWFMESEPLLYGYLTVDEQVQFYSRLQGVDPHVVIDKASQLGLGGHLDALCSTLSSGQRRKLWFSLAMAGHTCPVVLLDEPFNDVDSESVPTMIAMIRAFAGHGGAVVLSTHVHTGEVDRECGSRQLVLPGLREGKPAAEGRPRNRQDSDVPEWAHD